MHALYSGLFSVKGVMFKKIHLIKTDVSHSFVNSGSLRKKQDVIGRKSKVK